MEDNRQDEQPNLIGSRYRRVSGFFLRTLLHLLWWDVLVNRPGFKWVRPDPIRRWVRLAKSYRDMAVDLGGVLIKLGQFLSVRVDMLPMEVTRELAGLRDQVPPEPFDRIRGQLQDDFNDLLEEHFVEIEEAPLGAASLAQAHRARLPSGEQVVVKVFRPGIRAVVDTDLAAIARALRWLGWHGWIRARVDLDRLSEEFSRITRAELDTRAEGENAERFAEGFAADPRVHVPRVLWEHCAEHTLTMEDVAYIPLDDIPALRAAGIDEKQVAADFFDLFMKQVFETNFVHVDLHGGNVFIRPLPAPGEEGHPGFRPGDEVPDSPGRPFQIAFVDFGMMAEIPQTFRATLKDYAIGLGTGDARRIVQAYQDAGFLLPGADTEMIEQATADVLQRYAGIRMGEIRDVAFLEVQRLASEYRDLIYEAPFQFPVDLLFILRAIGLLSGMTTHLDPEFSPMGAAVPFAERLAREELSGQSRDWIQVILGQAKLLYNLPLRVDNIVTKLDRGTLKLQASPAPDMRAALGRIGAAIEGLAAAVIGAALLLAGVWLQTHSAQGHMPTALVAAGLAVMLSNWLFRRRNRDK